MLLLVSICSLAGCQQSVDLDAVRALASSATASQQSLDALASDYYDTCLRLNIYQTIGEAVHAYLPASPTPKQTSEPSLVVTRPPGTNASSAELLESLEQGGDIKACADAENTSRSWVAANDTLIAYFVALGKLAGGVPGTDDFGVKTLAKNVAATTIIPTAFVTVLGNVADGVLTQIYEAKRRKDLSAYIPEADKALQNVIPILEKFASDDYADRLTAERRVANRFFIRNLQLAQPGEQAFQVLSYADDWSERMKAIDDRMASITAYVHAWETLRTSHAKLLTEIDADNPQAALSVAQGIYTSISPDISAIQKAFKGAK